MNLVKTGTKRWVSLKKIKIKSPIISEIIDRNHKKRENEKKNVYELIEILWIWNDAWNTVCLISIWKMIRKTLRFM